MVSTAYIGTKKKTSIGASALQKKIAREAYLETTLKKAMRSKIAPRSFSVLYLIEVHVFKLQMKNKYA